MATISFQVTETGQTTLSKTYTLADAQLDRLTAAYQSLGNVAVGGTATRAQVLQTWITGFIQSTVQFVQNAEQQTAIAAVPPAQPITPV